ncbi:MAG: hypothetical protein KatS3mg064_1643 [Tepidiforma sp.]|nr:PDGLE domain-containing protein [Tepidiforma sp.]GIW18486.1 MAG: hypothetical protein KatS3mg064_1643 [Tepidiforma sp.]
MSTAPKSRSFLKRYGWVLAGLLIAVLVVVLLAPAASSDPDGLDRVAEDKEFVHKGKDPAYEWLPDYTIPGVDDERLSVILSGLIGVGIVFGVTLGLAAAVRASRRART